MFKKITLKYCVMIAMCCIHSVSYGNNEGASLPDYSSNLGEVFLVLMGIVTLIFFLAWGVRRLGYAGLQTTQHLSVKACLPLSTKEKLMVIQVGDQQVLIGVSPNTISHIVELKEPLPMTETESSPMATSFANSFSHYMKRSEVRKDSDE